MVENCNGVVKPGEFMLSGVSHFNVYVLLFCDSAIEISIFILTVLS